MGRSFMVTIAPKFSNVVEGLPCIPQGKEKVWAVPSQRLARAAAMRCTSWRAASSGSSA